MIKLAAIGHLGKDCTTNNVNGKKVINFSVAHTEKYKDQEKTTWIEAAYWNESSIDQYLKKGTQVYIEGIPEVRTYQKNDGTSAASLVVRVFSVQLLGSKQQQQAAAPTPTTQPVTQAQIAQQMNDDLPF
jgi:single-strand DNA-binding protein